MNTEKATLHQLLKGFSIDNFNRILYAKILIQSNFSVPFWVNYKIILKKQFYVEKTEKGRPNVYNKKSKTFI